MATDIITSKVYKLLNDLNIPNEDVQMRPQVVEKIIKLAWDNQLKVETSHANTRDKLVDASKRQSSDTSIPNGEFCYKCGEPVECKLGIPCPNPDCLTHYSHQPKKIEKITTNWWLTSGSDILDKVNELVDAVNSLSKNETK